VCLDLGAILFGDLVARRRRTAGTPPRALFVVATLLAISVALLPWAGTPWQAMAIIGMAFAGGAAVYTITTADVLGRMPPECVSSAGGLIAGAQSLALIIANPLVGRAVEHYGNYDVVALVAGAWVIPGALVWLVWRPGYGTGSGDVRS
jgi:predicted MFS family arabinose efflux permease